MGKELLIPSGSVLLNLACSGTWDGAFKPGRMVNLIGDSATGKTLLGLSMFGEAHFKEEFDNYRFIYDDAEHALEFDLAEFLGDECAERIEAPRYTDEGEPVCSDTVQDFFLHIMEAIEDGRPFIYILDSLDSLTSLEEQEHSKKMLKAVKEGKDAGGSYGTDKARFLSSMLRQIVGAIEQTQSFLLIISQTRDVISPVTFAQKTRAGGRALKFYASHEIWLAINNPIDKTVNNKKYTIGMNVIAKVSKNKLTGKLRKVSFPIYYSYGIDDVSSCIDFLEETGYAKKSKKTLEIEALGLKGMKDTIIKQVDDNEMWEALYLYTEKCWNEIEDKLEENFVHRRRKFDRKRSKRNEQQNDGTDSGGKRQEG